MLPVRVTVLHVDDEERRVPRRWSVRVRAGGAWRLSQPSVDVSIDRSPPLRPPFAQPRKTGLPLLTTRRGCWIRTSPVFGAT